MAFNFQQNYQQPMYQYPQYQQKQFANASNMIWVQGEAGYSMAGDEMAPKLYQSVMREL